LTRNAAFNRENEQQEGLNLPVKRDVNFDRIDGIKRIETGRSEFGSRNIDANIYLLTSYARILTASIKNYSPSILGAKTFSKRGGGAPIIRYN
jgi:hypothetical protein